MSWRRSSRRSPRAFFLLTFTLAVPFWLVGAKGDRLSAGLLSVLPSFLPVSALQAVCPLLAALILVFSQARFHGMLAFLRRAIDPATVRRKRWYVPVIVLPPLAMGLSYWVMGRMGTLLLEPGIAVLSVPALLALYFLAAVFEEGGWTGYATDPLLARWNPLTTSLLLGLVTAVFHVVPLVEAGRTLPWIVGWFAGTVAQRVLMVWFYTTTGRSVFAISVFHALVNVSESLLPSTGAPDPAVSGTVLSIMAALVAFLWRPKTLARCGDDEDWPAVHRPDNRQALWQSQRRIDHARTRDALDRVRAPTLVLWGSEDRFDSASQAVEVGRRISDATVRVLDGCGHAAHEDCPGLANAELARFLSRPS